MVPMDNHAFQSAHQDSSVSGRLIASRLFRSRGFGEVFSYRQLVFFSCTFLTSVTVFDLHGGFLKPDFGSFHISREVFLSGLRWRVIAWRSLLVPVLPLSSGFMVSPQVNLPPMDSLTLRGGSYHIGLGCLYSLNRT